MFKCNRVLTLARKKCIYCRLSKSLNKRKLMKKNHVITTLIYKLLLYVIKFYLKDKKLSFKIRKLKVTKTD